MRSLELGDLRSSDLGLRVLRLRALKSEELRLRSFGCRVLELRVLKSRDLGLRVLELSQFDTGEKASICKTPFLSRYPFRPAELLFFPRDSHRETNDGFVVALLLVRSQFSSDGTIRKILPQVRHERSPNLSHPSIDHRLSENIEVQLRGLKPRTIFWS